MNFQNKNILITGASSGIGLQLAKDLIKEGANLALLARRKDILDKIADESKSYFSKVITVHCDVTSKESVSNAFTFVKNNLGDIDAAILNAGVSQRMKVENFNVDLAENTFNVNVIGLLYCLNEIIPDFIEKKKGTIVGVSSLADARGFPMSAAYCSSKSAVSTFMESIRVELKKYNVKVITVKPGFVRTAMTDKNEFNMPFLMNVEEASQKIIKGLKKEKTIIQFPLPIVIGDKILKVLPNFLYDYLINLPLPPKKT
jgi:short-subunit dehydrogenase